MMKEKGKTKSEKVPVLRSLGVGGRTSLLFTFSLSLLAFFAANVARAANKGGSEISSGTIRNQKFMGAYEKSVYIVKGAVTFENCTFENVSADTHGSCVNIDWSSGTGRITFRNCRFVNCGNTTKYGGAIYIANMEEEQSVVFENCVAVGCKAAYGGFLYSNDNKASIYGSGTTIVSGCSAVEEGGGVYAYRLDTLDGFIFERCTASKNGGGVFDNNTNGKGIVANCRFYRNAAGTSTGGYCGGGLYVRNSSGQVKGCTFLENTAPEGGGDYDVNATVENCTTTSDFANRKLNGSPCVIKSAYDWDVLYYSVKCGTTYEGTSIVLSSDILTVNTIGGFNVNEALKRPFKGTFDGNGHTITLYSFGNGSDKAAFGCAVGAMVRNLTVDGRIEGAYSLGGIFGNGSGCTAENCTNKAAIIGTAHYIGGIAGWSGNSSKFVGCTNNGRIVGKNCVGGIAGLSGGNSRFLNCLDFGDVTGTESVGGIVGSEESAVSVENCHMFGSLFSNPTDGDFIIYTKLDKTMCLDTYTTFIFAMQYGELRIQTEKSAKHQLFTLKYDSTMDGYTISTEWLRPPLLLTHAFVGGESFIAYEIYLGGEDSEYRAKQRWNFISAGDGYYYIRSQTGVKTFGYIDVYELKNGGVVDSYYFTGGDNQKFMLSRRDGQDSGGITGRAHADSTHEMCVFDKKACHDNGYGTGVSYDKLWGDGTELGLDLPEAIEDINKYIKDSDKQKDGWLRVAFDRGGRPIFVRNGPSEELGYSVGQISETEFIYWKYGGLYRKKGDECTAIAFSPVTAGTSTFVDGGWYVVQGTVEQDVISVDGTANLVLLDTASLTARAGERDFPGISLSKGGALTVFGVESGCLTANGGLFCAGIGCGYGGSCGAVTIYGGTVTAQGGDKGAGIGSGYEGSCGAVTIYGGTVTAKGDVCAAGIGSGEHGSCDVVTIAGGTVTAQGGSYAAGIGSGDHGSCDVVTIAGGTVTAFGAYKGPGIGSGWMGSCDAVTIAGGTVTATGGAMGGAGIGSGSESSCGAVTVNGGTVTATGGEDEDGSGAGIGSGYFGSCEGVTIADGTVTATGGEKGGAGIGSGSEGSCDAVTITGGKIAASGKDGGEDIGKGVDTSSSVAVAVSGGLFWDGLQDDWIAASYRKVNNTDDETKGAYPWAVIPFPTVTVGELRHMTAAWTSDNGKTNAVENGSFKVPYGQTGVKVIFTPEEGFTPENGYVIAGKTVVELGTAAGDITFGPESGCLAPMVVYVRDGISYLDWDEEKKQMTNAVCALADCSFVTSETTKLDGGWYVVTGAIEIANSTNLAFAGDAHLILMDRASLTVTNVAEDAAAISVLADHTLTIYGQAEGSGRLSAFGGEKGAGIGSGYSSEGGAVTINGGTVTAQGGYWGAGVGSGSEGSGCDAVTINGGTVTALGGTSGAGIGSGCAMSSCGAVTVNGGTVTANGKDYAAGIGGAGLKGSCDVVTIAGGTVTAFGGFKGAGIGSSYFGSCEGVTIADGTVTAQGGEKGAGIGSGSESSCDAVTITGGKVAASGKGGGEDIGKGVDASSSVAVAVSGGIFKNEPENSWIADGYEVIQNTDKATNPPYSWAVVSVGPTCKVTLDEGVDRVIYGGQEYAEDFLIPDVAPGTVLTFTMVTAGDQYDEAVTAEGDVTGGKVGNDYVYTVASEPSGQNAAIRFNTTVAPAVAYAYEDRKIKFVARCSTFAEAWAYASDGVHYVKIFKDYTGSESSEQFALDGTMRVNFNGHTVYATAERGKGFAIETVNSRHRTYTPYDTIAEAYAMGGSQATYVVLGTADASTITLRPGNLGFSGHFWEGVGGIVGSIKEGTEPKLKNAEKTEKWSVSDTNFEFVAWTDKPTPLMPGQGSKAYETRAEAEAAAAETEVLPAEKFDLLGHPDALATWQGYFVNQVYVGGDGKFRIMPELNAAGSNAVAQAEAKLTRAIDVGAIAAATGAIEKLVLEGAEPGFYYTLFRSADVTTVLEQESHDPDNCDCKALSDGKVTFTNVTKPSAAAGFFSVRAFVKESFTNPFGGGGFGGFGE